MSNSDTPRTDAVLIGCSGKPLTYSVLSGILVNHSQALERELAAANKRIEEQNVMITRLLDKNEELIKELMES